MEMIATMGTQYTWACWLVIHLVGATVLWKMLSLMQKYHNFRYNTHKKELFTYAAFIVIFAVFNTWKSFVKRNLAVHFFDCFWTVYSSFENTKFNT